MGKILTRLFSLFILISILSACNEESCSESSLVNVNLYFYSETTNKALSFDTISVRGIGQSNDSILYDKKRAVTNIALPLHILQENTEFEINYHKSNAFTSDQKDTIRLYHKNNPFYISSACGCSVFATLDSVKSTLHRIKSIKILKSEITNLNEKHITILY